ncbi:Cytochrome P450 [Sesbania bispinosa]|nr:Cytochrome P450 [Sesbania bispinosa]
MSLKLGQVPNIVVSSSEATELFIKTHDTIFASRPRIQSSELLFYGSKGMAFSEYGPYWRIMRKLCTLQLLSTSKVELFAPIRREKIRLMVKSLEKAAVVGQIVNLSEVVENLMEDIMYKMILGHNRNEQFELMRLVQEAVTMIGAFNLADYVPWLAVFDLQGLKRGCKKTIKALDEVLENIITEHEQASNLGTRNHKDFVDILLSMMHQTIDSQKLLRHPRVMKILQHEIENEIGITRMVEEEDLMKLSYLDMVVDETLRLHPVAALIPRESRENITIDGYYIKKKSRVIINAWAIGRDPNSLPWDSIGFDYRLVHCFNWKLPPNVSPANLNMEEKFGLSIPRAQQLHAIPTYRLTNDARLE